MPHVSRPNQYIIPPHILRQIVERGDSRLRTRALRSLTIRARFQGRREVLSQIRLATPLGEKYRTVFDAQEGRRLPGTLARNEGEAAVSDERVNAVYDGLGAAFDLFHDVYGRRSLDNRGLRLVASVHYETDFDNAFWDGQQLVFGDGDGVVFRGFTRSLEVIGHELTHGLIQHESGLGYQDQPGALNESLADVFGSLVKQYHLNQDVNEADWLIGKDLLGPGLKGVGLRSLKAPGTAYDDPLLGKDPQVAHIRNYAKVNEDYGGVHINSGIGNYAFYLVAKQLGGYAWEQAGQIWYDALPRFRAETDFQEAATITYQVAGELYGPGSGPQQAVQSAWEEVGLRVQARATRRRAAVRRTETLVPQEESQAPRNGNGGVSKEIEGIKSTLEVIRQRVEGLAPSHS
jgi:Zn-dependent metalloprotease